MFLPVLLLSLAAPNASAAEEADIRCMAIFSAAASGAKSNPQAQIGLIGGVMFFYGKVVGRSPGVDVEATMLRILKADPKGEKLVADQQRCGDELTKHGTYLTEMGKHVSAAGQ